MGNLLSAILKYSTIASTGSQEHGVRVYLEPESIRCSRSRGSSLGPPSLLMHGTPMDDTDQTRANNTAHPPESLRPGAVHTIASGLCSANSHEQQQNRDGPEFGAQQGAMLLGALRGAVISATPSVPIPQLRHSGLRKRAPDTTSTRLEELQTSNSDLFLPVVRRRQETFGESIRAFPPRKLHAYPHAVKICPTVYTHPSDHFDVQYLVTEYGHGCRLLTQYLEAQEDELWRIEQQIRTKEDTIARLRDLQSYEECEALRAARLELSIVHAATEVQYLGERLVLARQAARGAIFGALTGRQPRRKLSSVAETAKE